MAKTYCSTINKRRKYGKRKGFLKNKFNRRPHQYIDKSPCLQDCANCTHNNTCTKLPYI